MKFHWYLPHALAAIARYATPRHKMTAAKLAQWADCERVAFSAGEAQRALDSMFRRGYIRPQVATTRPITRMGKAVTTVWVLTAMGWQAALAALRAMPGGPVPDPQALDVRLWNLLRIRRRLTADEAAQTLIDAAAPDWPLQKQRIAARLAAWAKHAPEAVCRGAKREAGQVRFVLREGGDLGRWPPPARAGELHPRVFSNVQDVPERYLKAAPQPHQPDEGQP